MHKSALTGTYLPPRLRRRPNPEVISITIPPLPWTFQDALMWLVIQSLR
ncbi:MAG: hypothetical protein N2200_01735 [Bacteroidia bacterium]|nr:hypothetical protein [Bacteroidia bacterium]